MAAEVRRTITDDTYAAMRAINDAAVELERWKDHLDRVGDDDDSVARAQQARNSGEIVAALVDDAMRHTRAAVHRARQETGT